jgi:hypothetical protein
VSSTTPAPPETDSRTEELRRQAEEAAAAMLASTLVSVHSVRYNLDPERDQIELFAVVGNDITAFFEQVTALDINQSAADQLPVRQERERHARTILGTPRQDANRFDIRLVSLWTGRTEATVRKRKEQT